MAFKDPVEKYKRLQKLCLAYEVLYQEKPDHYIVKIYSVQTGRSKAPLGNIILQQDEWELFHKTVYENWENLDPDTPFNDNDLICL